MNRLRGIVRLAAAENGGRVEWATSQYFPAMVER